QKRRIRVQRQGVSQTGVGRREGRIPLDRFLKVLDRELVPLPGALVPEETPFEVGLRGGRIDRLRGAALTARRGRRHLHLDFPDDRVGDFALQGQDVSEVPVVAVRPQWLIGGAVDQLYRGSDAIGRLLNRPLDYGVDLKLPRDVRDRFACVAVLHRGGARDHVQAADAGQLVDERLGHVVRQIRVLRAAVQVVQRKDDDRSNGGGPCELRVSRPQPPRGDRRHQYDSRQQNDRPPSTCRPCFR